MRIELNCDMGEGIGNDTLIMPYINSANIACGFHAGDADSMWQTVELAIKHNVNIGAHVSFLDRENFGRIKMDLTPGEIYEIVEQQLIILNEIIASFDTKLIHVKPHGALYNMSATDGVIAMAIANAVKDFDSELLLFGLSNSQSIIAANQVGLKVCNEVFADRTYQDDGSLTPRSAANALINDIDEMKEQVLQFINDSSVTTVGGKIIPVQADTICIHSDGEHAVAFAKAIHEILKKK